VLEQLAERLHRGFAVSLALQQPGELAEEREMVLGHGLPRRLRPIRISIVRQKLAAVQLPGCEVAGEPGRDAGLADGGGKGLRVDPESSVRAETEHALPQDEDALASLVGHAERGTSDAECLMEIVQGRIGRTIWPELLHDLLALETVAGRDRQHLHELARLA